VRTPYFWHRFIYFCDFPCWFFVRAWAGCSFIWGLRTDIRRQTHLIRILLISLPHFNTHSWRGNKKKGKKESKGQEKQRKEMKMLQQQKGNG